VNSTERDAGARRLKNELRAEHIGETDPVAKPYFDKIPIHVQYDRRTDRKRSTLSGNAISHESRIPPVRMGVYIFE
jgi:hypothetical protein